MFHRNFVATVVLTSSLFVFVNAFNGDMTYYDPSIGTGACGKVYSTQDMVAAIPVSIFNYANAPANPNNNAFCGQQARITVGDKSAVVNIVDKCPGCGGEGIDVSPKAFEMFASLGVGRLKVTWETLSPGSGNKVNPAPTGATPGTTSVNTPGVPTLVSTPSIPTPVTTPVVPVPPSTPGIPAPVSTPGPGPSPNPTQVAHCPNVNQQATPVGRRASRIWGKRLVPAEIPSEHA
ncbi:hypothetical protein AMATHDRAFT_5954 [Amanita thiersii Skay4041]|uniref:RlpA-like protein double-psi beta-barrel domain-containing protein n=1 Tax=Amanita thiersii Skay4041 TaxID=703135 RepID=A0A2A9NB86_9AGAR|nr:hypothetical protein AMATHDRAFT_5954 [Amanita thiersii Skay4041]